MVNISNRTFYFRWVINCSIGELAGIGAAGAIAYCVNYLVGEPVNFFEKVIVLSAMMTAGAIEGTLLGFFQWRILVQRFSVIPAKEWIFYTIAVAVLGWFLGMLPSLFLSLTQIPVLMKTNNSVIYFWYRWSC